MRHAAAIAVALTLLALECSAKVRSNLTILLDFDRHAPKTTMVAMERELGRLLEPAGLHVNLKLRSDVQFGESFEDVVVVTMKGVCEYESDPMLLDERGPAPLAYAHTVGTKVLPFTVVACDAVRRIVQPVLWGSQRGNADHLLGRAYARVLAHELFHVVEKTSVHSRTGIFRKSLTGQELVDESLNFAPSDIERLRKDVEARPEPIAVPRDPLPVTSLLPATDEAVDTYAR